jgi:hypothetical protein
VSVAKSVVGRGVTRSILWSLVIEDIIDCVLTVVIKLVWESVAGVVVDCVVTGVVVWSLEVGFEVD